MHPWGRVYRLGDSLESDYLSGVQDIPFYTKKLPDTRITRPAASS